MESLLGEFIQLHERELATKEDILAIPARSRGDQIYRMRGGHELHLNNDEDLALFADIVDGHTRTVLYRLVKLLHELEPVPGGAAVSPSSSPAPVDASTPPTSPFDPN